MKKLFVSYEIAKLLKEKGFNEECLGLYNNIHELQFIKSFNSPLIPTWQAAPLYQQVINWFKKNHEIYILPFIQFENKNDEEDEFIEEIYYIFSLPTLRESGTDILPYIQVQCDFDKGSLEEAIEAALTLI